MEKLIIMTILTWTATSVTFWFICLKPPVSSFLCTYADLSQELLPFCLQNHVRHLVPSINWDLWKESRSWSLFFFLTLWHKAVWCHFLKVFCSQPYRICYIQYIFYACKFRMSIKSYIKPFRTVVLCDCCSVSFFHVHSISFLTTTVTCLVIVTQEIIVTH